MVFLTNVEKVRITALEIKKLIQMALVTDKEVLQNLQAGKHDELSTCFKNMTDAVFSETKEVCLNKGLFFCNRPCNTFFYEIFKFCSFKISF
jgi:hypothetical protein